MSEFISTCPKCRQRILCDTQYAGMRVACPLCLQDITMPAPPVENHAVSPSPSLAAYEAGGRRGVPVWMVASGVAVLLLVVVVGIWAVQNRPASAPAAPLAAAQPAPVSATPVVSATPDAPETLRAMWTFDRDRGKTVIDGTGNGYNLNLVGEHAMLTGDAKVGGGALSLSAPSYAETAGPVVNTTKSFTVAAWVKLAAIDTKTGYTFVSIDGADVSGFFLQLNHRLGDCFAFSILEADNEKAPLVVAKAEIGAAPQVWYHLAGVYDANNKTISLYVNGNLQQSTPFTTPWQAFGKTAIGRGYWAHANRDWVNGVVDDVRIYPAALSAVQIWHLAGN